jgi:hypothetical protein
MQLMQFHARFSTLQQGARDEPATFPAVSTWVVYKMRGGAQAK